MAWTDADKADTALENISIGVWENGTLQTAALHAAAPWKMRLHCAGAEAEIELSARQSVTLNAALQPIH